MRDRPIVRLYIAAVFIVGCGVVALLSTSAGAEFPLRQPAMFGVLAAGVLLGEMLPIKVRRAGRQAELTLSASFAMALLLAGGLVPAAIAQGIASVVQDIHTRKPWSRVAFNLGQYSLAMAVAELGIRALSVHSPGADPFDSAQLPAMMVGVLAFFAVNTTVVGIAFSLHLRQPIHRYFASNTPFELVAAGAVLMVSPIVLAAAAYSTLLVPLCLAPVVAIYSSVWQSARSEHAALHDPLTELPNRAAFQAAMEEATRDERQTAFVLLLDLDRFKDVNDTLGHRYGDLLLKHVAKRFSEAVGELGAVARLGGDEFAVVGPEGGYDEAAEVAARIAAALRDPIELEQVVVDVQASVGIALFPLHGTDVETLLQKADVAMYRAKETRSDVALYDERHDHHSPAKLALTAELRTAVAGDEIILYYQPELDLRTRAVMAVEALVRWHHPRLGLLGPDTFVRMAEATNLIKPLTHRVIGLALRQAADWHALGLDISVAVNISPQVLVDHTFTDDVLALLRRSAVAPDKLKLEVTESALMSDPVTAHAVLAQLHALGVEISIDDFGTGYSSLAYLARLPVCEVKIDQSFVRGMSAGSSEQIIVNSTIDLAHHLQLRAVAEGVEDPALLPQLEALGCDVVQGFAISQPLPSADATRWLLDARTMASLETALGQVA